MTTKLSLARVAVALSEAQLSRAEAASDETQSLALLGGIADGG